MDSALSLTSLFTEFSNIGRQISRYGEILLYFSQKRTSSIISGFWDGPMRLLERNEHGEFSLTKDFVGDVPAYTILSHTWGDDDQEVTFKDIIEGSGKSKIGYHKIRFCGDQATRDGYRYFWVDTCCIDKSNYTELSEALNSMYRWYQNAAKCYVYLTDVSTQDPNPTKGLSQSDEDAFRKCRWFSRGWTLQELIAPQAVEFFSAEGKPLGDKKSLEQQIHETTGIPVSALRGTHLSKFSVEERFSWAANRETKKAEDKAYSLFGIFSISLPLIYGEGHENAFRRLQEEVYRSAISHVNSNKTEARVLPSAYDIPFQRNRRFIGRSEMLKDLTQKLLVDKECQKLAIVGLGGIGKTQVALEFAYTVKVGWPEYSIFWVPAVSMESMEQACGTIARKIGLSRTMDDKEDAKEAVKEYLSNEAAGKWLMVVDNADDRDTLFGKGRMRGIIDYLPESEHGLILFTTRVQEIAVSLVGGDIQEVERMQLQESLSFLGKSLIRKSLLNNDTVTLQLLDELAYFPLAISQAVAYLNTNKNTSIAKYLELLRNTEEGIISLLSQDFHDGTRYKNSNNAVTKTWLISFDQIRDRDPLAADLLSFMSCIEWKAIPRSILPSVQPEERMVRAIGTLCGYSFLVKRDDEDKYDIHRLVHLATMIWVEKYGNIVETAKQAVIHISDVFPFVEFENRAICRDYLTHALCLLKRDFSDIDERYTLCLKIGNCLEMDGRVREAVAWCEECCQWREKTLREEDPDRLTSQHELARVYMADGQTTKAVKLLTHVVQIREKTLTKHHPDRLSSQHELAGIYMADGQITQAIMLLKHVVQTQERILIEEHPDRLHSQHELARAYMADGQTTKAVKLLTHVVQIRDSTLVEEHPDRLTSQHELAAIYMADGQVTNAILLLTHVVQIQEKILKEEHPDQLTSQHELARAYLADGQTQKAIELFQHVVQLREKTLMKEHPDGLASQNELARAFLADGQVEEAIELLENIVAIEERLTEKYPDQIVSQNQLARAYLEDGQITKATKLLRHVIVVRKQDLRADHPSLLESQELFQRCQQLSTQ